jgi:uncharacterized protein YbaA (DUF1428 family)
MDEHQYDDFAKWATKMALVHNIFDFANTVNCYTDAIEDGDTIDDILDFNGTDNIRGLFAAFDDIYKREHPIEEWFIHMPESAVTMIIGGQRRPNMTLHKQANLSLTK